MRHYKKGRKLGTDASHTRAMKKSLVANLFANDRIKTTLERAKEIRGDVDRVITWAKRGDVHSRRLAIAKLGDKHLVSEIFAKVEQGMFADRPGGYSRILRLGTRRGDSATIVIMELVLEPLVKKASTDAAAKTGGKSSVRKPLASRLRGNKEDDGTVEVEAEAIAEDEDAEKDEAAELEPVSDDATEAEAEAEVEAEAAEEPAAEPEPEIEVEVAEAAEEPAAEPEPAAEAEPEVEPAAATEEAPAEEAEAEPEAEAATEPEAEAEPEAETEAEPAAEGAPAEDTN
jgi:large subunit ribosomal protein L17